MPTEKDVYYRLTIGSHVIAVKFIFKSMALWFGMQHKQICEDCRDKPLKIEEVRVLTETVVSYDETKERER